MSETAGTESIDLEIEEQIVVVSGSTDYEDLENKPTINNVELIGNKTSANLGLADANHTHTISQITGLSNENLWAISVESGSGKLVFLNPTNLV